MRKVELSAVTKFDVTGHRNTEYKRGAFVINEDAGSLLQFSAPLYFFSN